MVRLAAPHLLDARRPSPLPPPRARERGYSTTIEIDIIESTRRTTAISFITRGLAAIPHRGDNGERGIARTVALIERSRLRTFLRLRSLYLT